jgi:arginine exporter protein ArgO
MLDDAIVLGIGVITLSRHRLQEKEGRWLKLVSGLAMVTLGVYLLSGAGS